MMSIKALLISTLFHWRKENIWRENNVFGAAGVTGGSST
jgi:hypothetical protein